MKRSIITVFALLTFSLSLDSCSSPADKVGDAKQDVEKANRELEEAEAAYQKDLANYRQEIQEKIASNEALIAEMRAKNLTASAKDKAEREVHIAEVEQRNNELRSKLDNYDGTSQERLAEFRDELNHDMNELGESLKNLSR
jgi:TolA-binding protein